MTPAEIVAQADKIKGWMHRRELFWLAERAAEHSTIIEIGSWMGRSTTALALATPGRVYAIDTFEGIKEQTTGFPGILPGEIFQTFMDNMRDCIRQGKVVVLVGDSQPVLKYRLSFLKGMAGMIFIDGDHTKKAVRSDIEESLPLLRPGGLICGHDWGSPPVREAVLELLPNARAVARQIWRA